jgi:hypothetical protein
MNQKNHYLKTHVLTTISELLTDICDESTTDKDTNQSKELI